MQEHQQEPQGATAQPEAKPESPLEKRELTRGQKKWLEKKNAKAQNAHLVQQIAALKSVAEQINATAQLAVGALQALALKEITLSKIEAKGSELLVVFCEPGRELRDEVCDELIKLLKMPLVVLPKDMRIESLDAKQLEAVGLMKKETVRLVDAQGQDLKKS